MLPGAIVNLDDLTKIDHMKRAIGMPDTVYCYNPGKFQITNDIMGHLYDFKFGMTKPQLLDAYAILKEKGVQHFGLHCMAASCSLENGYYPALARELFRLVCEICDSVQCIRRQRLALIIWRHSMWTRYSRRQRGCCDASK